MFVLDESNCSSCGAKRASSRKRTEEENGKPPWRKILWEKQPYEDNHVDNTFLIGLRQNVNVVPYDYWTVVMDSAVVTQQITVVALFLLGFFYTYSQLLALPVLSAVELALLVFGYLVRVATEGTPATRPRARSALVTATGRTTRASLQSSWGGPYRMVSRVSRALWQVWVPVLWKMLLVVFGVLILSPVLLTLTAPISTDTITSLTVITLVIHLATFDYSYERFKSPSATSSLGSENDINVTYTGPISLNAAIFASVLLTSRLSSIYHVFAVVYLAIELFALFPIMRYHLMMYSVKLSLVLTWSMFLIVTILIVPLSKPLAIIYVLSVLFVTFVCPYWLKWVQQYKNEISGPWDEAVPVRRIPRL